MIDLSLLNEEQRGPVLDTEGAVLVLAGAGSGKTRVLTTRIAHLIEDNGVPARNILAITFTNKAANEMRERLELMTDAEGSWVCTIHSMCVKILRMFGEKKGITKNFSIYSETERNAVIKQAYKELGFDDEKLLKEARYHISEAKMLGEGPKEYLHSHRHTSVDLDSVMRIYEKYNAHLHKNNALDFDDLLIEARALLSEDKETREYLAGRFRYIHVDEFQDTNAVQFDIIRHLSSVHGNLFVVGDDDQSIYGWRGAEIENILHFERSFPKAKVYKLQRNYRSTKKILALANASIANNEHRNKKKLWTEAAEGDEPVYFEAQEEADEALYCARIISDLRREGYRYSDFAVLMRINALTRSYEQEFNKYGIHYKVFGGFKFYERKEVKDILAYLRIAANPFDDEALQRIVNVPRRGIGEKTMSVLASYAEKEELSLYDAVLDCELLALSPSVKAKLKEFGEFIRQTVALSQLQPVHELVRTILHSSGMYDMYSDNSDESLTKRANLDEFQNSVDEYVRLNGDATLTDYLQQITLYSDTDEMDDGDYVTLATIHAVKGLEFRCVFLVGLEENILPTSRAVDGGSGAALEEERRLMYVAITRAKEKLWLTRSLSRYLYGRRESTVRSSFVDELKDVLDLPEKKPAASYNTGYNTGFGGSRYGGYGSNYGGSYGSSAPKRVGTWSQQNNFPSYGAGKPPVSPQRPSSPATPAPRTVERRGTSRFTVGVRVRHARFGEGEIVSVRGDPGNRIITVDFPVGKKELAAALAPLEIVE